LCFALFKTIQNLETWNLPETEDMLLSRFYQAFSKSTRLPALRRHLPVNPQLGRALSSVSNQRPTLIVLDGVLQTVTDVSLINNYRASKMTEILSLDASAFGEALDVKVARKMSRTGEAIHFIHRDYFGISLFPVYWHPYKSVEECDK
jgi:hypothetical protein